MDAEFRVAEREAAAAPADLSARARLLRSRMKSGEVGEEMVLLAAYLGHLPAQLLLDKPWCESVPRCSEGERLDCWASHDDPDTRGQGPRRGEPVGEWLERLARWGWQATLRAGIAVARALLPIHEREHGYRFIKRVDGDLLYTASIDQLRPWYRIADRFFHEALLQSWGSELGSVDRSTARLSNELIMPRRMVAAAEACCLDTGAEAFDDFLSTFSGHDTTPFVQLLAPDENKLSPGAGLCAVADRLLTDGMSFSEDRIHAAITAELLPWALGERDPVAERIVARG